MAAACGKSATAHLDDGNRLRGEKRYADAVLAYRSALTRDANLAQAQLGLAETLLESGDTAHGVPALVKAADMLPDRPDVQVRAGSFLILAREFDGARRCADRALARDAKHVDALVLRANALAGLSDMNAAIAQVEAAIALDPKPDFYTNLGTLQQVAGESSEAEQSFRRAIALDPTSTTAVLALANYQWAAGRMSDAEATFKRALALDAKHALANRALATFYLSAGRLPEAEPYLVAAGGGPDDKIALAVYYAMVGRAAEAERLLDEVATTPSRWASARTRVAALRLQAGKAAEALKIADEVLARNAGNVEALLLRARALLALHRPDEARPAAEAAIAADPRQVAAHYMLGTILAAAGDLAGATASFQTVLRLNPRATAAQVQLARLELLRGAPAASAQLAADALAADPANPEARLMAARAAMAQRQFARAAADLAVLLQKYPKAAVVHQQMGLLLREQGRHDEARRAFEKALSLDPDARDSFTAMVDIEMAARRPAAARAIVERRLAAAPNESWLQVLAARVALAEGKPAEAERRLRETIERDPAALDAYGLLGRLYLSQRRLDEARQEFDRLAAQAPQRVAALTMAGIILQTQGRRDDARARYEQVVQRDAGAAVAANNLAWIYAEQKTNLAAALQLAQAAQARLPDRPEVLDTVGFVYLQQGQPRLAAPFLEEAVKRDPGNAGYRHHLGLAYQGVGDVEGARRELRAALDKDPSYASAGEVRKALEALR